MTYGLFIFCYFVNFTWLLMRCQLLVAIVPEFCVTKFLVFYTINEFVIWKLLEPVDCFIIDQTLALKYGLVFWFGFTYKKVDNMIPSMSAVLISFPCSVGENTH